MGVTIYKKKYLVNFYYIPSPAKPCSLFNLYVEARKGDQEANFNFDMRLNKHEIHARFIYILTNRDIEMYTLVITPFRSPHISITGQTETSWDPRDPL